MHVRRSIKFSNVADREHDPQVQNKKTWKTDKELYLSLGEWVQWRTNTDHWQILDILRSSKDGIGQTVLYEPKQNVTNGESIRYF
jgi:hypothetical protein